MSDVQIKIVNTATPYLRRLQQEAPAQFRRAMKSAGWWLRERVKEGIEQQAPAGQPWVPFSALTTHQRLRRKGRRRRRRYNPLGRLKQANVYRWYGDSMRVKVGWVSRSAEQLGQRHERGYETRVTPQMRRFYWACGVPLSRHITTIKLPRRPTFDPVHRRYGSEIPKYLDRKIQGYLRELEGRR